MPCYQAARYTTHVAQYTIILNINKKHSTVYCIIDPNSYTYHTINILLSINCHE